MGERITVSVDPDLEDLMPGFIDNRNKDVVRLAQLVDARDFAEIRLVGHSMKGVGGGYGFDAITEYGAGIEEAALREDEPAIRDLLARLTDYLERVEVVFEED